MIFIQNDLDKALWIKGLRLLISEYVPFGRNAMMAFNKKMDAFKDVKDSLITAYLDDNPGNSLLEIEPVKTRVVLLTCNPTEYSNFIAELIYPEFKYIVQKEYIGASVNQFGRVILGMNVDQMENNKDNLYFDFIPRLIIDVCQDSSRLIHDLLSVHQRELLELNYFGKPMNRQKYHVVIGDQIFPEGNINSFLDRERKENELKQILEYVEKVKEFKNGDKVFVGTSGSIIISKNMEIIEPVIVQFSFSRAINVFMNNFFNRIFGITDSIKQIKSMTQNFGKDPRAISECQERLAEISANCVLMSELSGYIKASILDAIAEYDQFSLIFNERQKELAEFLDIDKELHSNYARINDIMNLMKGLENDMNNLKNQIAVIQEKRLQQIFRGIKDTGQIQRRMHRSNERQENKMQVLEIILSGSLAFEILSTIVGDYSFSSSSDSPTFFGIQITSSYLWFFLNIILWFGLVFGILKLLKYMTKRADDTLSMFVNYDCLINVENFSKWLENSVEIISAESEEMDEKIQRTLLTEFLIDGRDVEATIIYDDKNGYLNSISLEINQPRTKNKVYYETLITKMLRTNGVFNFKKY